ncbi:hypothetical protein JZ751_016142 [Albula glossodonta]|uniref:Uncharacterized protein n=1 Tax=Albula glossodonta TaxID=121402 RepID=A0A8T2MWW0_9TELE|nr:hypothetical protein JZ751_016142 [Albula glossodonta]
MLFSLVQECSRSEYVTGAVFSLLYFMNQATVWELSSPIGRTDYRGGLWDTTQFCLYFVLFLPDMSLLSEFHQKGLREDDCFFFGFVSASSLRNATAATQSRTTGKIRKGRRRNYRAQQS